MLSKSSLPALALTLVLQAACSGEPVGDTETETAADTAQETSPEHVKEFVFLGEINGEPVVLPLSFRAVSAGAVVRRSARGWLAHGENWDSFMELDWEAGTSVSLWRVVPTGGLRVLAGGPAGIEALLYQENDQVLRLALGDTLTGWNRVGNARFRLADGSLARGAETVPGTVLEVQHLRAPPSTGEGGADLDWLFATDGGDRRILIVTPTGEDAGAGGALAALIDGTDTRRTNRVEVTWTDVIPVERARRDMPLGWRYRIPDFALNAEVERMGNALHIGPERRGRRSIEVRYTVAGVADFAGEAARIRGAALFMRE